MRKFILKATLCSLLSAMIALPASVSAFATDTSNPRILFELKTNKNGFQYIKENENVKADKITANNNSYKINISSLKLTILQIWHRIQILLRWGEFLFIIFLKIFDFYVFVFENIFVHIIYIKEF